MEKKKEREKIKQRYQICGCLFIDLFETILMQNFCGRLWGFSHTIFIQAREGCLFDHLFLSTLAFSLSLPQEIADWVLSFWARLSFPLHSLSLTHTLPQWAQISLLKKSQCNKTWSNIDSSRAQGLHFKYIFTDNGAFIPDFLERFTSKPLKVVSVSLCVTENKMLSCYYPKTLSCRNLLWFINIFSCNLCRIVTHTILL